MKAVIHSKFGPPDELQVEEISRPVPKDKEVLIKILRTTVTTSDCNCRNLTFAPKIFHPMAKLFMFGIFKPRHKILGIEFAGLVEDTGKDVTKFKSGDEVFGGTGMALGAYAEYKCFPEEGLYTKKPAEMSWEDAAALSLAGGTALYYVRDQAKVKQGDKILIHGASGAIGTSAVQLAKHYGAEVTGVCSAANVEKVKSLGADHVIDYTKENYYDGNKKYDFVFNIVGHTSFKEAKKVLERGGVYLTALTTGKDILRMMFPFTAGGIKTKGGSAPDTLQPVLDLKELYIKGAIKPVIDKVFSIDEIVDAFKYVEGGHKKGTVIIKTQD